MWSRRWRAPRSVVAVVTLVLVSLVAAACGSLNSLTGSKDESPGLGSVGNATSGGEATSSTGAEANTTGQSTAETGESDGPAAEPCAMLLPGDEAQEVVDRAGPNAQICFTAGRYNDFSVIPESGQHFLGVFSEQTGLPTTVFDGGDTVHHAFWSSAADPANDVIIEGIEFSNYRSPDLCDRYISRCSGAPVRGGVIHPHAEFDASHKPALLIEAATSSGWVVRNNVIRDNQGSGLLVGEAMLVTDNHFAHNSHLAIGGGGVHGVTISNNTFLENGLDERVPANWEAGQIKLGFVSKVIVTGNTFDGGAGPAIWCDIQCTEATITDNTIRDTSVGRAMGIHYEISESGVISGNNISELFGECELTDGTGIMVAESRDVLVTGNTISETNMSIRVQQINRGRFAEDVDYWAQAITDDTDSLWRTDNVTVTGNTLVNSTAHCPDAPWGQVGMIVRDLNDHPNTTDAQLGVLFEDNDFGPMADQVLYYWPPGIEPRTATDWASFGLG